MSENAKTKPPKRFIGAEVDERTYRRVCEKAKREDRSVSSIIRKLIQTIR